jgi:hypothetical protein
MSELYLEGPTARSDFSMSERWREIYFDEAAVVAAARSSNDLGIGVGKRLEDGI